VRNEAPAVPGGVRAEPPRALAPSDRELLDALPSDPDAFATLYDRHASLVHGLALSVLREPAEAADLTQEIFVSLHDDDSYDPARGPFEAFLVTRTRSRAIDRLRRGGRHLRLLKHWHVSEPPDAAVTPHQVAASRELAQRVRAALSELSEREREVIELSYYRDMTQAEIAEHLQAPLGSVKSWARRGLSRLHGILKDLT
jgi:RNA polymerase sigma-70 factor, ECF subfamily